jgi:hypothetical protein
MKVVEDACLKKMAFLEGRTDTGRTKPAVIGLGQQYLLWENKSQHRQRSVRTFFQKAVEMLSPS